MNSKYDTRHTNTKLHEVHYYIFGMILIICNRYAMPARNTNYRASSQWRHKTLPNIFSEYFGHGTDTTAQVCVRSAHRYQIRIESRSDGPTTRQTSQRKCEIYARVHWKQPQRPVPVPILYTTLERTNQKINHTIWSHPKCWWWCAERWVCVNDNLIGWW